MTERAIGGRSYTPAFRALERGAHQDCDPMGHGGEALIVCEPPGVTVIDLLNDHRDLETCKSQIEDHVVDATFAGQCVTVSQLCAGQSSRDRRRSRIDFSQLIWVIWIGPIG